MVKKWIAALVLVVGLQAVLVLVPASAVKRIGNTYPVQGVFVSACTDTNTPGVTADCVFSTNNNAGWTDLPGATSLTFPAASGAVIFARFSGQERCTSNTAGLWCLIRMQLVNTGTGTATNMLPYPSGGWGIRFDTSGSDGIESHTAEQVSDGNVAAGNYYVKVQVSVGAASGVTPTFAFKSWTLTTEVASY